MIRRAFQWSMFLVLCREAQAGEEGTIWRHFEFADGSSFTARLMDDQEESYTLLYGGSILQVSKEDVKSVTLAAPQAEPEPRPPATGWNVEPPAPAPRKGPEAPRPAAQVPEVERFRSAIEDLAEANESRAPQSFLLLGSHIGQARPLLHAALQHPNRNVRSRVLKLLGAMGSLRDDFPAASCGLEDVEACVRLAAVEALRSLATAGSAPEGRPAGTVVRTKGQAPAQRTVDLRASEALVTHLAREKDREVRDAIHRALTDLTGRALGKDPAAWRSWLDDEIAHAEAEKLIQAREADERLSGGR